ncbi:GATA zinc finger domain-containing protein [Phanerochaete sordida]|uniref:GATA zinc finger domain-containing protein n=1 Tax=Phanerochaete sordida TaxID=48140 RepID=A0A9P3GS11_9APHY|nr:GATA zinc finger domain-containing protein [Phanerochaete sordida]
MPPNTPHDRSQHPRPTYSDGAPFPATRTLPQVRPSSYSSLEQALVPPAHARDSPDRRRSSQSREALRSPPAMSSDGRYLFHGPPDVPAQYPYPYPPYDPAQYPPSSSRPPRAGAPPPHASPPAQPPPAPYSAPPQGYPAPGYPPPPYGVPPPPNPPAWNAPPPEGWQPYPPPFVPAGHAPAAQEGAPSFSRQDAHPPPPPAGESSSAPPPGPPHQDTRRAEDRAERPPGDLAPPARGRRGSRTENEGPGPLPVPPPAGALDYHKLLESFQFVLNSTSALVNPNAGRGELSTEAVDQMLRAAADGLMMLDAATRRAMADMARPAAGAEEGEGAPGRTRQVSLSRGEQAPEGGQTCLGCNATSTPEWRRGPMGPRTLCNACGLVYAKLLKKRSREPGRSRGSGQARQSNPDALSSGEDGSDNESNGSQERQSEPGDAARR